MTRAFERLLHRLLVCLSALLFAGALVLLACAFYPQPIERAAAPDWEIPLPGRNSEPADTRKARLLQAQMSRGVIRSEAAPAKTATPELNTLLRVKGIMDFGNPNENEAVIEIIRSGQTRNCRVGDSIAEVNAKVVSIDTAVTFSYDGKSVRLSVNSGETVEARPTAGSGEGSAISARESAGRSAP